MAVTNSNILGVYVLDGSTSTSAYTIVNGTTDTPASADFGSADATNVLFVGGDTGKAEFGTWTQGDTTWTPATLNLMGCATNTSLDISNSIDETVCRDGSGNSTRHIVSGATSWTVAVDGLLGTDGVNGHDVVSLATGKYFVIVRFADDVTDGNYGTSYIGQALVESANISGGVDDITTYNVSLSGQGNLYTEL